VEMESGVGPVRFGGFPGFRFAASGLRGYVAAGKLAWGLPQGWEKAAWAACRLPCRSAAGYVRGLHAAYPGRVRVGGGGALSRWRAAFLQRGQLAVPARQLLGIGTSSNISTSGFGGAP